MRSRKAIVILGALVIIAVCVMVTALAWPAKEAGFVPPCHDECAVVGMPSVNETLDYKVFYSDGMPYRFHVCMRVTTNDTGALVYFTNPAENDAWLKLRITDTEGTVLGESGLVYPGEYIESVVLHDLPSDGEAIILKVMGYERETYHSVGAVSIQTKIINS